MYARYTYKFIKVKNTVALRPIMYVYFMDINKIGSNNLVSAKVIVMQKILFILIV
jgi:hypothetical protein